MLLFLLFFAPNIDAQSCPGTSLNPAVRQWFLQTHNNLRSQIALGNFVVHGPAGPQAKAPAADMLMMVWDCSLEQQAQRLANTCPGGRTGRQATSPGQNSYVLTSFTKVSDLTAAKNATDSWMHQFNEFGWPGYTFTSSMLPEIGSATQMVWAASYKLGCGLKHCPTGAGEVVRIYCLYEPAGNFFNHPIYNVGPTCSKCPKGTVCDKSSGLCMQTEGNISEE